MHLSSENTALVLDSTADLPDARERHPNWRVVPLYVTFGTETFRDYVDITPEEFYRRLRSGAESPRTSQPTPGDFAAVYETLSDYERILCIVVSAKLSGTYESARLGAEAVGEGRMLAIYSASASGGLVVLAEALPRRLERGTTEQELLAVVERFKREAGLLFTVDTLDYLVRGGRVGKAAGFAGELLSVKPVLTFEDGEVVPLKRVRGRGKALSELERTFAEATQDDPGLHVGVAHADAREQAEELAQRVERIRPRCSVDVVAMLGPVVGAHAGPGTLGLFWFQDDA